MCKKWVESYPESIMVHGAFVCSDHCPILLSTRNFVQQCKKLPFRFQNFWCQYKQLDKAVIPPWHTPVSGTQMYKIMQRLKNVKLQVKGWAHQFFGNTRYRLDQNEIKLRSVEDKLLLHPDSLRLNDWIHRLLRQREKLLLFN